MTLRTKILKAIDDAWANGVPLSQQVRAAPRYAPRIVASEFGVRAIDVANEIRVLLAEGIVRDVVVNTRMKTRGLCTAQALRKSLRKSERQRGALPQAIENKGAEVGAEKVRKCETAPTKSLKRIAERKCGGSLSDPVRVTKRGRGALKRAPARVSRRGKTLSNGTPFEIGDVVSDRGQRFICIDVVPCVRKSDGRPSAYSVWRGECADCGARFTTNAFSSKWRLVSRRCPVHRQPRKRTQFAPRRATQ
jgi:hypothetical protein